MIAWLHGIPMQFEEDAVILNVQGVGYHLLCSGSTLKDLEGVTGAVAVYVHTHVREDALTLFGFTSANEKALFLSLIKVNGIGPRSALHILSASTWQNVVRLIESEDVKGLAGLPKIGKKTAEQIVLTLKGKLVLATPVAAAARVPSSREQIMSALVHLGFKLQDAEHVVQNLDPALDVEQGVRQSLALLAEI